MVKDNFPKLVEKSSNLSNFMLEWKYLSARIKNYLKEKTFYGKLVGYYMPKV